LTTIGPHFCAEYWSRSENLVLRQVIVAAWSN
jgi:hypothetical protein